MRPGNIYIACLVMILLGGCQQPPKTARPTLHPTQPAVREYRTALSEIHDENGNLTGTVEALQDANGEFLLDEEGQLIPHGRWTLYWSNGRKKTEITYIEGVRHGPRTSWYEGGQLWIEGRHVNGKSHGKWTIWYSNGRPAQEFNYVRGAEMGTRTEWYTNGKMRSRGDYVNGKKQGTFTHWDERGLVATEEDYVDGVLQP